MYNYVVAPTDNDNSILKMTLDDIEECEKGFFNSDDEEKFNFGNNLSNQKNKDNSQSKNNKFSDGTKHPCNHRSRSIATPPIKQIYTKVTEGKINMKANSHSIYKIKSLNIPYHPKVAYDVKKPNRKHLSLRAAKLSIECGFSKTLANIDFHLNFLKPINEVNEVYIRYHNNARLLSYNEGEIISIAKPIECSYERPTMSYESSDTSFCDIFTENEKTKLKKENIELTINLKEKRREIIDKDSDIIKLKSQIKEQKNITPMKMLSSNIMEISKNGLFEKTNDQLFEQIKHMHNRFLMVKKAFHRQLKYFIDLYGMVLTVHYLLE